ncbi:MAG TPA: Rrf2 family transcriptional regulator [Daejeonella sp.]
MISKACRYGIRAVVYLASRYGETSKSSFAEISREVDAPEAYTAKILQILTKSGIISSIKGPNGGFYMERLQIDQAVINIVDTIDGLDVFYECGLGLKQCSASRPCPMHDQYKMARETLLDSFSRTTIEQLARRVKEGSSFVRNLAIPGLG